jgi:hypothetical protein
MEYDDDNYKDLLNIISKLSVFHICFVIIKMALRVGSILHINIIYIILVLYYGVIFALIIVMLSE